MSYEPRLIAPYAGDTGLSEYYRPWLVGDAAFAVLEDAYVYKGKVRKREGDTELAVLEDSATINAITNANPALVTVVAIGDIQNGDTITIYGVTGMTELNGNTYLVANVVGNAFDLNNLDGTNVNTLLYGVYAGAGTIHFPVNGLANRLIRATVDEELIAFDRYRAYRFNTATGFFNDISFFQTTGANIRWTGNNTQYFWSLGYADGLWISNNVDPIRFYNGTAATGWNNQRFTVDVGGTTVTRARLLFSYYGRMLILDTTEGANNYYQRARWSQIGTPYVPATGADPAVVTPAALWATDILSWRHDVAGRGGYIDANTNERIVSAALVSNTLVVFFQFSTWRLRYTGDQILPFVWERINSNYGSESQFGTITFDTAVFTVSRRGFIGAEPNNVKRIDEKIPDRSFQIETGTATEGMQLVSAARDYYRKIFYWAVPSAGTNAATNNKIISYNTDENAWAILNQSYRVFGQYKQYEDRTWAMFTEADRDEWENQTENYWQNPFLQDNAPSIVAGHLNGFVYFAFQDLSDGTDHGTNFNFDIQTKRFNPYIQQGVSCRLQYVDVYITSQQQQTVPITVITQGFPAQVTTLNAHNLVTGTELYFEEIEGMPEINNIKYSVTIIDATNFTVDGLDSTTIGPHTANTGNVRNRAEITLEHYINDNDTTPAITRTVPISLQGQESRYTRVFVGNSGNFHQIRLKLSDSQLADNIKGRSGFELQGMVIWTKPDSRIRDLAS